jgi:hypothetical protein
MNTRKYPRTLNEAFGPYSSGPISEPEQPMDWQDVVVLVASIVTILVVAGMALAGVL